MDSSKTMKVITWGTRGSLPVAGQEFARYGGNTTCLEVRSRCLPDDMALVFDAGTGFLPFARSFLQRGLKRIVNPHTHFHHDHTQGMLIAPPIYIDKIELNILGPEENGVGPEEVYSAIMQPPYHPVSIETLRHHIKFIGMEQPSTKVILIHPQGGYGVFGIADFNRAVKSGSHLMFNSRASYAVNECLVIKMHWSQHPERTVAYRVEEMPTGKVFTFLTDEEVRAGTPGSLKTFLSGTQLIVQDGQYTDETYRTRTAGFGHGTPSYAIRLARECNIPVVGLTHHDPSSTDEIVDKILAEGLAMLEKDERLTLFACADGQEIEV